MSTITVASVCGSDDGVDNIADPIERMTGGEGHFPVPNCRDAYHRASHCTDY